MRAASRVSHIASWTISTFSAKTFSATVLSQQSDDRRHEGLTGSLAVPGVPRESPERIGAGADQPRVAGFSAHTLHLLGDIATHRDQFEAESGDAHYRQALALAEPRGMRPLIAHCHLGLGKLYGRTGDGAKAQEHLTTAANMYREMAMGFWLAQPEAALGSFPG